jgi:dienelactone hydrolase
MDRRIFLGHLARIAGGTAAANKEAAELAWQRTLAFFKDAVR